LCLFFAYPAWSAVVNQISANVPGRYLVILKSGVVASASAYEPLIIPGKIVHEYNTVFRGFSVQTTEAAIQSLAAHPDVSYISEVRKAPQLVRSGMMLSGKFQVDAFHVVVRGIAREVRCRSRRRR
jgi:hypothetical protein